MANICTCIKYHSENYLNYPWLDHIYGGLNYILYREPSGKGEWKFYTDKIWHDHCANISHDPNTLVEDHYNVFINLKTKEIDLLFYFNDLNEPIEPTIEFYILEAEWFEKHPVDLCY